MSEETVRELQRKLVETLRQSNALTDGRVAQAFLSVPRHLFLPGVALEKVYADDVVPVRKDESGKLTSSSSQPAIMAIMLEQLELQPGMKVLEIGAGSGFNAALIAELVGPQGGVVTIDIQPDLIEEVRQHLAAAGYGDRVKAIAADGGFGYLDGAPYDRIILTVGSTIISPHWFQQLREGGRIVLPLQISRFAGWQKSMALEKRGEQLAALSAKDCGFMMLQGVFTASEPVYTPLGGRADVNLITPVRPPFDADALAGWAAAPQENISTGVHLTLNETVMVLTMWVFLHEQQAIGMIEGNDEGADLVPPLMGYGEEHRSMTTNGLVAPDGLAVLCLAPGMSPYYWQPGGTSPHDIHFDLHVRRLGAGEGAARKLIDVVRAWDQAGRPGSDQLRFRLVPADRPVTLASGEFLVEKPYMNLVVRYAQ